MNEVVVNFLNYMQDFHQPIATYVAICWVDGHIYHVHIVMIRTSAMNTNIELVIKHILVMH